MSHVPDDDGPYPISTSGDGNIGRQDTHGSGQLRRQAVPSVTTPRDRANLPEVNFGGRQRRFGKVGYAAGQASDACHAVRMTAASMAACRCRRACCSLLAWNRGAGIRRDAVEPGSARAEGMDLGRAPACHLRNLRPLAAKRSPGAGLTHVAVERSPPSNRATPGSRRAVARPTSARRAPSATHTPNAGPAPRRRSVCRGDRCRSSCTRPGAPTPAAAARSVRDRARR